MNRSVAAGAARVAGGTLMALAVVPVVLAGATAAHASDPAPAGTPYAQQVGIGTAVKIGAPGTKPDAKSAATSTSTSTSTTSSDPSDTSTETPSGAVVIETESHQAASPSDTSVGVLGTKVGQDQLASTGPSHVTVEALLALALIVLGAAMRSGPQLALVARRTTGRRH